MIRTLTEVNIDFPPDFDYEEAMCIETCSSDCPSCDMLCDKDHCYCNERCECFCDEDCYLKCENDCKEEHSFNKTSEEVTTTKDSIDTNNEDDGDGDGDGDGFNISFIT